MLFTGSVFQQPGNTARRGRGGFFHPAQWLATLFSVCCSLANADEPVLDEFVPELPKLWLWDVELHAFMGFRDNLTLSRTATEESILIGSGIDLSIARLPLDGKQFTFLLSMEDIRYPQGVQLTHENTIVALAQFKVDTSSRWRLGVDARHVFEDQVVDTTVTETNLTATHVRGNGLALTPNARWTFARDTWLELSGSAQRQFYREPLDDYWDAGPGWMLGRDFGHRSSLSLAGSWNFRDYDTREQVSLGGTNIPGTSLKFLQHNVELIWRHNWDPLRRWRTNTRLGFQDNQDNGPGFYDYQRYLVSQQLRYVAATWELKAQGRVSFYAFEFQRVSTTDPESRRKAIVNVSLRGAKKLGGNLSLFAEYGYEQSLSNRLLDEYRSSRVAAGADVVF